MDVDNKPFDAREAARQAVRTEELKKLRERSRPSREATPKMWSPSGRIGRLRYLGYLSGGSIVFTLCMVGLILFQEMTSKASVPGTPSGFIKMSVVMFAIYVIMHIIWTRRRLNDLDHSGWIQIFPHIIGIVLFPVSAALSAFVATGFWGLLNLYLVFWPGSDGDNRWGEKPAPNQIFPAAFVLIVPLLALALYSPIHRWQLRQQHAQEFTERLLRGDDTESEEQ